MEFASPIITEEINYIRNVEENMKKLKRKRDELASVEKDLRTVVASAEQWKAKKLKEEVNNWFKNVEELKNVASKIEKEFEEESRSRMRNIRTLRTIGKRSLELIEEVDYLLSKMSFDCSVIASTQPARMQILPTTSSVGSTAKQNFKLIWNLLKEENIGIIGIYGMGGVGKTTLMKKINNHLEFNKRFDIVIWVTVSQDFNLKRLQSAIAKRLHLHEDLDEQSLAIELHAALRGKKFLLILDDMWGKIPLDKVGIPKPSVGNGCKVALTTRRENVCQLMEANKVIKIERLSEEEAWLLFEEKVGATALVDPDVKVLAKLVANECGGLPLALITVGGALRDVTDVGLWRHAENELRNSKSEIEDMENEVFTVLRFSYNYLKSDKLQTCFLYCSLFPEDYNISEGILIELWIHEGFIEEDEDAQAMVDRGKFILTELVKASMLERSGNNTVKMHDLMRDMAIGITRKSPIFMVKVGIGLEKVVPDREWAEDVERISLRRNTLKMLSGEPPKCPKLLTLFLNENPISYFESHSFFQRMNQLRVLDLSETEIEELPESISSLENLHMLKLYKCKKLKIIPSLAKLKELKLLDISFSGIQELPVSFSDLENLRELDAFYCDKLNTIPCFAKLKELRMLNLSWSGIEVLSNSLSGLEKLNVLDLGGCEELKSVPCLAKLKNLKTLDLSFTCIEELPEGMEELVELTKLDLQWTDRLRRFPIEIFHRLSLLEYFNMVDSSFLWSSSSSCNEGERKEAKTGFEEFTRLTQLSFLNLDFEDISSFQKFVESMRGSISKIKIFYFRVVNSNTSLNLFLREHDVGMEIKKCEDMKTGLPQLLLDLENLELAELMTYFEIRECKGMECLLVAPDYDNYNPHHPMLLLSKVQELFLEHMPDLRALQKVISLDGALANLQVLCINNCPKLKSLFFLRTLQNLQNLNEVAIEDCIAMEEVVAGEEDDENGFNTIVTIPNLNSIKLIRLPALQSICSKTMVCSSLRNIVIVSCCRLNKIPLIIDKPCPDDFKATVKGNKRMVGCIGLGQPCPNKRFVGILLH